MSKRILNTTQSDNEKTLIYRYVLGKITINDICEAKGKKSKYSTTQMNYVFNLFKQYIYQDLKQNKPILYNNLLNDK